MRDIYSDTNAASLIGNATLSADNVPASVDLKGYHGALVLLSIGAGGITFSGTNKIEFVLTHSDDDSSYSNVADADMIGVTGITNGIIKSLVAAHASPQVYRYGYIGGKRYLKLLADFSGTHGAGTPIGAGVLRGRAFTQPVAAQA